VALDSTLRVRSALMRLGSDTAWVPMTVSLCAISSFVGLQESPGQALPQEEISFAFQAILAQRIRSTTNGMSCGSTLTLKSTNATTHRVSVQTLQGASEHSFVIQVVEQDRPSIKIPVMVRLMKKTHWQGEDVFSQSAYAFLGSMPGPCDITSSTTLRRLEQGEAHAQAPPQFSSVFSNDASDSKKDGMFTDVFRDKMQYPVLARQELFAQMDEYVGRRLQSAPLSSVPVEYDFRQERSSCLTPPHAVGHAFLG
jgi:hypothetical protein